MYFDAISINRAHPLIACGTYIWSLCRRISDVDGDGALNVGEFTVAMHLINAKLSGRELPRGLPPSIRPCMDRMIPGVTSKDYETYVKAFIELDKNQTGNLTGLIDWQEMS